MNETYTATELVTIMAAFGVLIGGIGAVIVNIVVAIKTSARLDRTNQSVAEVSAKADVIAGHVNSSATLAQAKIAALEARIESLIQTGQQLRETAALLAQTTAQKPGIKNE